MSVRAITLLLLAPTWFGLADVIAQADQYQQAYERFEAGDLEGAREKIDSAIMQQRFAAEPGAWLLRGFVYKDLYKRNIADPSMADPLRDLALVSLSNCLAKDSMDQYSKDARQAYDFLSKSYYNDAARALNALDAERATQLFAKYKETASSVDPGFDPTARELEFMNALGTVYTKLYNQDRADTSWFDKAVRTYREVLDTDSLNYGANYNLATLFYNRGVYNIQRITPENDIPDLQAIQKASKNLFARALPYMLKAHELNPGRKETLLGLEGIYYSLQNNNESEKYRKLYEDLYPGEEH